ncbi:MAG: hypothetical protein P1V97_20145 [Planctomycetota bacterium]|nr:hypothetical protein [Planctomycetota bacterium]
MDELREALNNLLPILVRAQSKLTEEQESLEARCREAELEAYSWDLSAQKGAEMQLEEHSELQENVLAFKQSLIELVSLLD